MASTAFLTTCCNNSFIIDSNLPSSKSNVEIKVISLISVTIALSSSLGILVVLYPCGRRNPHPSYRRYLLQSKTVNGVTRCLIASGLLANLGLIARSCFWLAHGYPNKEDTDFNDYKHISCIVLSTWIVYFFLCVVFWHVVYAIETLLACQGKKSTRAARWFMGWFLPASITSIVAFLSYHPALNRCSGRYMTTRTAMFIISLLPILVAIVVTLILFYKAQKEVKRSLIVHFGVFAVQERERLDHVQVKLIIIAATFCLCWFPNLINGVFMTAVEEWTREDIVMVLLVLECVLNPFQVLIDAMVMYGFPPDGCCSLFKSRHTAEVGIVNSSQSSDYSAFNNSERDPLLSFSGRQAAQ